MRTTLDIDDDVLAAVKDLAKAEGKTAGAMLSELARRALTTPSLMPPGLNEDATAPWIGIDAFPSFPRRGDVVVTMEHVRQIQEEIDREEGTPWDHSTDQPRRFD